jgi:ATP-binding cassette subfamily A (ABC1) protein 3
MSLAADALGDSIAILATGRLRAIGSPLFLKNRFGAGYSLNVIAAPERMQELRDLVHTNLPGAEIVFGG